MTATTLAIGTSVFGNDRRLAQRIIEIADDGGKIVLLTRDITEAARFIFKFKLELWAEHIEVIEIAPH